MGIAVRLSGALRPIIRMRAMHLGVLRMIRSVKVMSSGSLRTVAIFAPPVSASISPEGAASGYIYSITPASATCGPATCVVAGGAAPYQYAWSKVSGDTFTVTAPNSATTYFYSAPIQPGLFSEATYRCTVTDALGQSATVDVYVIGQNLGGEF